MKTFKIEKRVILPIFLLMIISVVSIYSACSYLPSYYNDIWFKQIIYYGGGIFLAFLVMYFKVDFFVNYVWWLYFGCIVLLFSLLLFGVDVNGSKCWFMIGGFSFQPSEFMRIVLILTLAKVFCKNDKISDWKDEFKAILIGFLITIVPSIFTFLQPDTGAVMMYFAIYFFMLIAKGIRFRWFLIGGIVFAIVLGFIIGCYFLDIELFVRMFGSSLFYRLKRIFEWSNMSGMQLTNSLIAIGSGGFFGFGFNNTPIYFPEPATDFIFSTFASNFGFIGSCLLIITYTYYIFSLVSLTKSRIIDQNRYIIYGVVGVLIFQCVQNIGMTIGLVPIMGITLPFISYGGSSLVSYMIILGVVFSISHDRLYFRN